MIPIRNGVLPFKTGTRRGNPGGNTPSTTIIFQKIIDVKAVRMMKSSWTKTVKGIGLQSMGADAIILHIFSEVRRF